jgi:hypothetical protein
MPAVPDRRKMSRPQKREPFHGMELHAYGVGCGTRLGTGKPKHGACGSSDWRVNDGNEQAADRGECASPLERLGKARGPFDASVRVRMSVVQPIGINAIVSCQGVSTV